MWCIFSCLTSVRRLALRDSLLFIPQEKMQEDGLVRVTGGAEINQKNMEQGLHNL